jgi:hypothetical protein
MEQCMTLEEVYEEYSGLPLLFTRYYKYIFTYEGRPLNGGKLYVDVGGTPGDIYRMEVTRNMCTLVTMEGEPIRVTFESDKGNNTILYEE